MIDALIDHRYRLLELIGTGGEARVFRARDEQTQSQVALRFPLHSGAPKLTGPLPSFHPLWSQLLAWGTDAGQGVYQVLELLRGETLAVQVEKAPLDRPSWTRFVRQSLEAVEAVHDAGWIHGDLNAQNFLRLSAPPSAWKLLELPFLRWVGAPNRTALFGSIYTLAPEQLDGARPGLGSDLYALGCLYYYAACGHYPHERPSRREIAVERLRFPAEPLGEKETALSPQECAGVMNLLAREPADRVENASAARQLLAVA